MKYIRQSFLSHLFLLSMGISLIACTHADSSSNDTAAVSLSDDLKSLYQSGQALVLYSYQDHLVQSEAYADWQAYLNDFKKEAGQHYFYTKVAGEEFGSAVSGATEFTIFLKKGHPAYFYDGLIVEPQVYTAIYRKFSNKPLADIDKAFMPEEMK